MQEARGGHRGRGDKSPAGELIGSRWRYLYFNVGVRIQEGGIYQSV